RRHCSPSSSRTPLVPVKAKMSVGQSEVEPLPFRVPRDYPHSRFSKAPLAVYPPKGARAKACRTEGAHIKVTSTSPTAASSLSFSSTSSSPSSAPLKSSLTSPASHKNQEKFVNGRGPVTPRSTTPPSLIDRRPSPSRSPLEKRPAPSPSPQDRRPAASTSPSPSLSDRRPIVPPSPPDKKHQNGAKGVRHRRVSECLAAVQWCSALRPFLLLNLRPAGSDAVCPAMKEKLTSLRSPRSCRATLLHSTRDP
ncbi:hypothetical protein cypCar_00022448, partial [Cyprinus carpio]